MYQTYKLNTHRCLKARGGAALLPGRDVLGTGTRHLMWHVRQIALPAFDFRRKLPSALLCGLWQLAHSTVAVAVDAP